jgi:hypothetical protein
MIIQGVSPYRVSWVLCLSRDMLADTGFLCGEAYVLRSTTEWTRVFDHTWRSCCWHQRVLFKGANRAVWCPVLAVRIPYFHNVQLRLLCVTSDGQFRTNVTYGPQIYFCLGPRNVLNLPWAACWMKVRDVSHTHHYKPVYVPVKMFTPCSTETLQPSVMFYTSRQ